jgi:hypothetical protein
VSDSGYISRKTPKQYEPPTNHVRCSKKNCSKCLELESTAVHIDTPVREKYQRPGAELELIERFGEQ